MPSTFSMMQSAALGMSEPDDSEYSSIVATCWLTPIKCLACGAARENAEITFTAIHRGTRQRVLIQNRDPAAFLVQYPSASQTVEIREEESVPFCRCAKAPVHQIDLKEPK